MTAADRGDFAAFFGANYPVVVGVLALALGDRELARESAQEAFARALERWPRVAAMSRPDGWVYVTAMNVARRERRSTGPSALRGRGTQTATVDVSEHAVARVLVDDALRVLPARQREAVVLRYAADLTVHDVASAMGCAVGTAKATLHQALRNMRIDIGDSDER